MDIPWVEKYRPTLLKDVVLEPLNSEIFKKILTNEYFPNMLIYGSPGCGKTTICVNLINEYQRIYSRINKSNVIHLNASDERGIDIIRNQIHQFVKSKNLFENGLKFVILDEADYMTKNAQQALKYILQSSNYNVRFCLICNYITKIDESLKNDFLCIRFNQLPKPKILQLIRNIATLEKIEISDDIINTIQDNFHSDIRSMINYIQLNQNIQETSIINTKLFKEIHQQIQEVDESTFIIYIHDLSIKYNIDKRSIIQKWLDHLIRHCPEVTTSTFLLSIEIVLHRYDIPIDVHIKYIRKLMLQKI